MTSFFFFSSRRRHTSCYRDWSSDVCSSDLHAGELETSVMLHCAPELLPPLSEAGPGAARRFKIAGLKEGWAWAPRQWRRVTDDTGVGNPGAATAEKGKHYVDAVAGKIGAFLVELAETEPGDMYERTPLTPGP